MAGSALIDTAALTALLGSPRLVVLDCRFDLAAPEAGRHAYLAAHIPGARYADLHRDLSSPPTATSGRHPLPEPRRLRAWLRGLGVGPGVRVVTYDEANAAFAARAWWLLRWLGHREVCVLDGGFNAWLESGGRFESGEARAPSAASDPPVSAALTPPTDNAGAPHGSARSAAASGRSEVAGPDTAATPDTAASLNTEAVVDTEAVMRALERAQTLLIDARAPQRFAGAVEPIDPVAGHVPGAVNHPFQSNVRADGRFLPREDLARRWRERLAGRSPAEAIIMCGSGVTACQNLLAMEIAGLPGAKLYAGSWSEWIRDPSRPVARGT